MEGTTRKHNACGYWMGRSIANSHLMASIPKQQASSRKKKTTLDFHDVRDNGVLEVASVTSHANNLHLAPDRQSCPHFIIRFLQAGWYS